MMPSAACWTATNGGAATTMSTPSGKSCRTWLCSDSDVPSSSSTLRFMVSLDRLQHLLRQAVDDLDVEQARPGHMVAGFFQADHTSNRVDPMHREPAPVSVAQSLSSNLFAILCSIYF